MRKFSLLLLALVGIMLFTACSNDETYADQKKKERSAINSYIANQKIKVITEDEFFAQDSTTDVSKNEFVLFESSGVYMQIVRKGQERRAQPAHRLHTAVQRRAGILVTGRQDECEALVRNIHSVVCDKFKRYVFGVWQCFGALRLARAAGLHQARTSRNGR